MSNILGRMGKAVTGIAETAAQKGTQLRDKIATDREMADLAKQESDLLLEIGKAAYEANPTSWPQDERITQIRAKVTAIQEAIEEAAKAAAAGAAATVATPSAATTFTCPACGQANESGVKFCVSCGTKLEAPAPLLCSSCGTELPPGTRFCGVCGTKQED